MGSRDGWGPGEGWEENGVNCIQTTILKKFLKRKKEKKSADGWWRWLHSSLNVLNAAGLSIEEWLKGQILFYVFYQN